MKEIRNWTYSKRTLILGFSLVLSLLVFYQSAQAQVENPNEQQPEESDRDSYLDYKLQISPFFWLLGIKGEIIAPPIPSILPEPPPPRYDVDIGFADVITNLKFFIMLSTEFKSENFVAAASITSLILQGEAITPVQVITEEIEYRFSYLSGELTGGYRFIKKEKLNLDISVGLRILNTRIEAVTDIADIEFEGERSLFWYDPILAGKLRYIPWPKLEFEAYTDFGPIRQINSYQFYTEGTYHFTPTFNMALGFRNYYVNTEAEEKTTIYRGRIYGPYLRFGFQF